MTLAHRVNTTAADVIANISAIRWDNLTEQWGGMSNSTTEGPNWGTALWNIVLMYPDSVGPIAWVILFSIPFLMMWITHADIVPAALVGLFFGIYVFAYIGDQYYFVGVLLIALAISSILYSLYQKRG
jgi:hypothetical protein